MATAATDERPRVEELEFHLPLRTEADLREFVGAAWGLVIPDRKVCAHHTTPWRAFVDAYFAHHPVTVWLGSRGLAGKTHTLGGLALTEAVTYSCNVNVLGGSREQSERVLKSEAGFWAHEGAPRHLLVSEPGLSKTRLSKGQEIRALTASTKSARGAHPPRLRIDEADEMDDKILRAVRGQPQMQRGVKPQIVISSTLQYPDGTMAAVLQEAREKGWPVYEWCYRETLAPHGWLPQSDVEMKRTAMTREDFRTEVELQEPNPQGRAFDTDVIKAMFQESLGDFPGDPGKPLVFERPQPGAWYAVGIDWAAEVDWTIILVLRYDVRPMRVVSFARYGRIPWPVISRKADAVLDFYSNATCLHDGTGVGKAIGQYLKNPVEEFIFVGHDRTELLSDYVQGCEHAEIVSPMIRHMYDEHRFAKNIDLFGGRAHHLPDSIAAGALAYRVAKRALPPGSGPESAGERPSPWIHGAPEGIGQDED